MDVPGKSARIAVSGAGSWGTALSMLLARNGHKVILWDRDSVHIESLREQRENRRYLPGIPLPDGVQPVDDLRAAMDGSDYVLVAVPSHGFREMLQRTRAHLGPSFKLIWATKGLEPGTGKFLHQVVDEELPGHPDVAAISGPSFAKEVAKGLPTAVTVASRTPDYGKSVAELLHSLRFRAYTCEDILGVELGGSAKNVLAIAAGISDGLGYGANARAALITRGLAEIMRLGARLGGQRETFMGLAGVGDLVLTCTDDQSRNRRLGLAVGRGVAVEKAAADIGQAVEGLHTARELDALAQRCDVEMPITHEVKRVLFDGEPAAAAVDNLLARESKPEGL